MKSMIRRLASCEPGLRSYMANKLFYSVLTKYTFKDKISYPRIGYYFRKILGSTILDIHEQ